MSLKTLELKLIKEIRKNTISDYARNIDMSFMKVGLLVVGPLDNVMLYFQLCLQVRKSWTKINQFVPS